MTRTPAWQGTGNLIRGKLRNLVTGTPGGLILTLSHGALSEECSRELTIYLCCLVIWNEFRDIRVAVPLYPVTQLSLAVVVAAL